MKVLFITTGYRGGGAERHSRELFERLPALGVQPTMLVAHRSPDDPPGVRACRLPGEKYLRIFESASRPLDWRHLGSRFALDAIRSGDYDLVHLHNLHGGWISLGAVGRLARRLPTIWSLHDEWAVHEGLPYDLSGFPDRRWLDDVPRARTLMRGHPIAEGLLRYGRKYLPRPRSVITYSEYMHRLVSAAPRWKDVPNFLVRYGVTMLEVAARRAPRTEARHQLGIDPQARTVLLIANHLGSPFKGMPLAFRALRALARDAFTCLLVGTHPERLVEQIPQRCLPIPFVNDPEKLALIYRAADVMLFPSVAEAFGLVATEALACETPVVGFAIGGITEQIGEGNERGRLVPPFDTDRMAASLAELLANPIEAGRLGRAGRDWVERYFRMSDSVDATFAAYRATLALPPESQAPSGRA